MLRHGSIWVFASNTFDMYSRMYRTLAYIGIVLIGMWRCVYGKSNAVSEGV